MGLQGKVAIVTGAAQGIGRASAVMMAEAGAAVVVADLNHAGADAVAGEVIASGGAAIGISVDVSEPNQVESMIERTVKKFGRLDILFNNAGLQTPEVRGKDTDVVGLDLEVWEKTIAVNLTGPMLGCRFAIPHMIRGGGGSIINTSSGSADLADRIRCAYGTSKAGLNALTKYVAAAFGKNAIRCNAIAPGMVDTPGVHAVWSDSAMEGMIAHHMLERLAVPEDIAALAVFLAGQGSAHITGQVITVDGGFSGHLPSYAESRPRRAVGK